MVPKKKKHVQTAIPSVLAQHLSGVLPPMCGVAHVPLSRMSKTNNNTYLVISDPHAKRCKKHHPHLHIHFSSSKSDLAILLGLGLADWQKPETTPRQPMHCHHMFIIWQCVKTNSTPVVHIKIAGIYGCSSH